MFFQNHSLKLKAVLFDCDGTLVDSEHTHYLSWRQALQKNDYDLTLEEYYPLVGQSSQMIAKLLAKKTIDHCPDRLLEEKRAHHQIFSSFEVPTIESTIEFLHCLLKEKERLGLRVGVCSSSKKKNILSHLKRLGVEHLVDLVVSGQEDLAEYSDAEGVNKPKPYIYLHAMKMLGVFPVECVVIEDSASGVRAGIDAGCTTLAVPNAYTRFQDLSHAHLQIKSFAGINLDDFFQMVGKASHKIVSKITDVIQGCAVKKEGRPRRIIITGGPGSGKTSLVNHLARQGYPVVAEAATDVIKKGYQKDVESPWKADDYHVKVSSLMTKRQKEVENSQEAVVFFDRGHLDGITYILLQRRKLPQEVVTYVQGTLNEQFFDKTVFFIENLKFCEQAPNRDETLDEALVKSSHLRQNYLSLGYEVITIPPGTIEQRSKMIIDHLKQGRKP